MIEKLVKDIKELAGDENFHENEPMSRHISFKVGGPAKYYVTPVTAKAVTDVIIAIKRYNEKCSEKIKYFVMGNGSNVIFLDEGYDGIVIKIGEKMSDVKIEENISDTFLIKAQAGALMSKIASMACCNGLEGMECLAGIPGTIGGAVAMNAGAYGGEIKDIIESATVLDRESGEVFILNKDQLDLSYRHSVIMEKNYIVLEVTLKLKKGNIDEIKEKLNNYARMRREKQPLEYPSAGSTFKRPEGYFAGKLIQDAGLRGYSVGGAQVSEKHCGFVINKGGATAEDILSLIDNVKSRVSKQFGVNLELEVRIVQ